MTWSEEFSRKCQKVQTILGAFLVLLPVGLNWYWGNMSVYILSYILYATSTDQGLQAPWIVTVLTVTWTVGFLVSGAFTRVIGKHPVIIVGIFMFNSSIFLSYFSIQQSLVMTTFSLGAFVGFSGGLLEGVAVRFVVEWATTDTGFLTAFVLTAFPTGAICVNQFVKWYINPTNMTPDLSQGKMSFFSQKEILQQVPSMFFVLGAVSGVIQILGFFLLREIDSLQAFNTLKLSQKDSYGSVSTAHTSNSNSSVDYDTDNEEESAKRQICPNRSSGTKSAKNNSSYISSSLKTGMIINGNKDTTSNNNALGQGISKLDNGQQTGVKDYRPSEILQTGAFYIIAVAYLCGDTSFLILNNYYKSYGMVWIKDDHFLTDMVTIVSLVSLCVKIIWGLVIDRTGHENSVIGQFTLMSLLPLCIYFAPTINKWLYLVVNVLYSSVMSSFDTIFMVIVVEHFGKTFFSTNLGLVTMSTVGAKLAVAPLLQFLLAKWGWFSIFAWSTMVNMLGLCLLATLFVYNRRNKDKDIIGASTSAK